MHIDNTQDIIDVRDVIARFEELEYDADNLSTDEYLEREGLLHLLHDLRGEGGDERWRGDWYPVTLISDYHFVTYAQDLAEDLYGSKIYNASWPFTHIDWERAADELQMDYTSVEFDGVTYWYR